MPEKKFVRLKYYIRFDWNLSARLLKLLTWNVLKGNYLTIQFFFDFMKLISNELNSKNIENVVEKQM